MSGCYYLDASALVKRYAPETGSRWVVELTNPGDDTAVLLSEITLAEVAAALAAQGHTPVTFVAADEDLLTAARALGLSTANPLSHQN